MKPSVRRLTMLRQFQNSFEKASLFFRYKLVRWFEAKWAKRNIVKLFPASHSAHSMAADAWWSIWFGENAEKCISAQTEEQAWIETWEYIKTRSTHGR